MSGLPPLTPTEVSLLREIHQADLERGGLHGLELTAEETETCGRLADLGLAERVREYGEAPDGEEDERDAGGQDSFRITGRGVEALADVRGSEPV